MSFSFRLSPLSCEKRRQPIGRASSLMVVTVSGSLRFPLGTATSNIAVAGILRGNMFRNRGAIPHPARRLTRGHRRFRGGWRHARTRDLYWTLPLIDPFIPGGISGDNVIKSRRYGRQRRIPPLACALY